MKKQIAYICAGLALLAVLISILIFFPGRQSSTSPDPIVPLPTELTGSDDPETLPPPTTAPPPANLYHADDFSMDENGYMVCLSAPSYLGVDVSEYQGEIDWQAAADSGVQFAIIRVGFRGYGASGKLVEDEKARTNIENALAAGLKVGVYFFSQATTPREAIEEAQMTLSIIRGYDIQMPVVYDWEYISEDARTGHMNKAQVTACATAYCEVISLAGYQPMFYSNQNLSDTHFNLHSLAKYPMWLAMYDMDMTYPHRLFMWQYTCSGSVPGIEGDVDMNIFLPLDESADSSDPVMVLPD